MPLSWGPRALDKLLGQSGNYPLILNSNWVMEHFILVFLYKMSIIWILIIALGVSNNAQEDEFSIDMWINTCCNTVYCCNNEFHDEIQLDFHSALCFVSVFSKLIRFLAKLIG